MRKLMFAAALSLACPLEWHADARSLDMANPAFEDPVTGATTFTTRRAATTTTLKTDTITIRRRMCSMP